MRTKSTKTTRVLWLAVLSLLLMTGTALRAQTSDVWDGSVAEAFGGGSGTEGDPYLISNGAQLAKLAQDVKGGNNYFGKYFKLTADIVLNNTDGWENWDENAKGLKEWTPIGNNTNPFSGIFDGDWHAVRGIYINTSDDYQGLFGYVKVTVRNVGVTDGYIKGGREIGGVCGVNDNTIEYCYNTAAVSGVVDVGGICGYVHPSNTINYCYNTGKVSGTENNIGGICGYANNSANISYCYNTGKVNGTAGKNVGDIVGCINNQVITSSNIYFDASSGLPASGDGTPNVATVKSTEDFKSGAICWLLNGGKSDGVWKQTLGTEVSPTFGGHTVYPVYTDCNPAPTSFTNNQDESNTPTDDHEFDENGICAVCRSAYQPAEKNADGVYEIGNAGQLYWFAELVNSIPVDEEMYMSSEKIDAVLTADITVNKNVLNADGTLNGTPELKWTPIGRYSFDITPYSGVFDGRGHTVSGLYCDSEEDFMGGLFGFVMGGTVKNVGVADSYFKVMYGGMYGGVCGGVCGCMQSVQTTDETGEEIIYNAVISNCWSSAVLSGPESVTLGGVCGYNVGGRITSCYSTGSVSGGMAGGVCGYNEGGQITICYWLDGTCAAGVGTEAGTSENVVAKSADDFKSGAVACLLQGDQTELAWGQAIGTDEYPVLTADEAKRVYAAKMYEGTAEASDVYAGASGFIMPEGSNAVAVIEPSVAVEATGTNVIVKDGDGAYTCGSLVLTDGADFYTPVAFTAGEATYSRTLPSTWGTIVLPFAAETVSGASLYQANGVVVSDGSDESILAVLPTDANTLEANTPALFKGETEGAEVSFRASDAEVSATADAGLTKAIGDSGYTLTGSMSTITLATGDLFISKDNFWSVGTQNTVGMQAFRAYIDAPSSSPAKSMRIMVGSTTDIRQSLADGSRLVDVYSLQGILLRKGVESSKALNGLPAGVYVVGGKKVKL